MSQNSTTVLITGISGYLAERIMVQLLEAGYKVRGTLRDISLAGHIRQLAVENTTHSHNLELVEADLLNNEGWDEAVGGCTYVLHVASPFPDTTPDNENELIQPAVEGTRRVLSAAVRNGVRRVVLTSSIAAVSSAHPDQNRTFSEEDWSQVDGNIEPYPKSKTLAEQAAWNLVENLPEGQQLELAVINPGYIIGPVLDDRPRTSTLLHAILLKGTVPGITRLHFNLVDVRDVAWAHITAMTTPQAAGKRFLCVAGGMWLVEFAGILKKKFGPHGYKVPTLVLPKFIVWLYGLFDKTVRDNAYSIGIAPQFDTSQIQQVLGWQPRSLEESIIEMGESMIALEMVG
jgi:nucleoside-diphosphate-sugar epimerase